MTDSGSVKQINAPIGDRRDCNRSVSLTIFGVCYSMKNSKIPRRNAPGMLKHPKARQFEKDFLVQVRPEHRKELGSRKRPLRSIVTVYYPSLRQDLDPALVYDLLQTTRVVMNDRYIREKHEFAEVDRKNPRVEILVSEITQ